MEVLMPVFMRSRSFGSSSLLAPVLAVCFLLACRSSPLTRNQTLAAPAPKTCDLPNTAVAEYTDTIGRAPAGIVAMLKAFPKGADLHNHLSGSVMPEDYVAMGIADRDCYGKESDHSDWLAIRTRNKDGDCVSDDKPLSSASPMDPLVRSLSMDHFAYPSIQAGHDHFFATFTRFGAVSGSREGRGKMLARMLAQAETDGVSYVETMVSFQSTNVKEVAKLLSQYPAEAFADPGQYPALYDVIKDGLARLVTAASEDITFYTKVARDTLGCEAAPKTPGCAVALGFLSEVNRNSEIEGSKKPDYARMFTQTAWSFALANQDDRVVGVNMVSGEDLRISMQAFPVQMKHFAYFHGRFPKAGVALHGGEITPCFVEAGDPAFFDHLAGSILAGARRIGHGVSFAFLDARQKQEVADLMHKGNVLVEVPFTSNAQILGVAGGEHPFTQYFRDFQVPVALSTDDEGVSHADFTSEWVYAYLRYHLTYEEAVRLARLSLQHSFLPGSSLWQGAPGGPTAPDCQQTQAGASVSPESVCGRYLKAHLKANLQWDLEARLTSFRATHGTKSWL
jgi:adenosine deaminase